MKRSFAAIVTAIAVTLFVPQVTCASTAPADLVTSRCNVVYGEAGGQKLLLDVLEPSMHADVPTTVPRPAIVFVHGGGWVGGRKEAYHSDARWFALQGYVAFCVNYRLVKPEANMHPAQIDDVQLAVRWIRAHANEYGIDPARIAAHGSSAGGHLVSLLGTMDTRDTSAPFSNHSSRPACIVDIFGPTDLTADFPTSGPFNINVQKMVDDLLGAPRSSVPDKARQASPLFHVDKRAVPFLIIHGVKDVIVPIDQSRRLLTALHDAGVEAEYLELPDDGHGFMPKTREQVLAATLQFLDRQLGVTRHGGNARSSQPPRHP